jgi:threonine dehydrogenase-like Zn-dependent dehydrogenase
MQALQITGVEQFKFVEVPVPEPRDGQVKIRRLGIVTCNAFDLHIFTGRPYPNEAAEVVFPYPPGYPGHEWVGEVVALGPGVTQLQVGDWVCMPGGRGHAGPYPDSPGGYTPYAVIHESRLVKVPRGLDVARLAPVEMASCVAANMLDLKAMNVIEGRRAGVTGLGPAGLIAAQMLRAEGAAEVIGLEVDASRRAYAVSKDIVDRAIDPVGEEGQRVPLRRRPGAIMDISVDCAGAPAAITYLMDHTEELVSLFAVQHGPVQFEGWPPGRHMGLKLCGYPGRTPACGDYVARRVANGYIDLSLTVSHTMRLEEYADAVALIRSQKSLKVMFEFNENDW